MSHSASKHCTAKHGDHLGWSGTSMMASMSSSSRPPHPLPSHHCYYHQHPIFNHPIIIIVFVIINAVNNNTTASPGCKWHTSGDAVPELWAATVWRHAAERMLLPFVCTATSALHTAAPALLPSFGGIFVWPGTPELVSVNNRLTVSTLERVKLVFKWVNVCV